MRLKFKNIGIAIILFGAWLNLTIKLYLRRTLVRQNFIQQKLTLASHSNAGYLTNKLSIPLFLSPLLGVGGSF